MIEYLFPKDGPVLEGFENEEIVYAADQPQYTLLRTLVSEGNDRRVLSRWTLTPEQRDAVARGADIFLETSTFGQPLQPIRMAVSDGDIDPQWIRIVLLARPLPWAKGIVMVESPDKKA